MYECDHRNKIGIVLEAMSYKGTKYPIDVDVCMACGTMIVPKDSISSIKYFTEPSDLFAYKFAEEMGRVDEKSASK